MPNGMLILAAGPKIICLMIHDSAATTPPRSDLSAQGCTTTVATAGMALAAAIRRSYLTPGRFSFAFADMTFILSLRISSNGATTPWLSDRKGRYPLALLELTTCRRQIADQPASGAWLRHRRFRRWRTGLHGSRRTRRGVRPRFQAAASEWPPALRPGRATT